MTCHLERRDMTMRMIARALVCGTVLSGGTVSAEDAAWSGVAEELCSAVSQGCELDLCREWRPRNLSPISVICSSQGWGLEAEAECGNEVSLVLSASDGDTKVLEDSIVGYMVEWTWDPDVQRQPYVLEHIVSNGGTERRLERLVARFSFEDAEGSRASAEEIRLAVMGIGEPCSVISDPVNPWQPISGVGSGLQTLKSAGGPSDVSFSCSGIGSLTFNYCLSGGTLQVLLDGVLLRTYDSEVEEWVAGSVVTESVGRHLIVFRFVPSESGFARVGDVGWSTADVTFSAADSEPFRADFRRGVRMVRCADELMPFTYSDTNFTGLADAYLGSVAQVRVVAVEGPGTDPASWTNADQEVAGTSRILYHGPGESVVRWRGKRGVWKATFDIFAEGGAVHSEHAIFDMRHLPGGMIITVR